VRAGIMPAHHLIGVKEAGAVDAKPCPLQSVLTVVK
jgi:hypothetical protein